MEMKWRVIVELGNHRFVTFVDRECLHVQGKENSTDFLDTTLTDESRRLGGSAGNL